jgi:hypothetical protein
MTKKAIFINEAGYTDCASTTYSSTSPATCTVGGVSPGYVMTGKTLECIVQDAFAPYVEPTFSVFNVALDDEPFEVGCVLSGSKSFSWTTTTGANVTSGSVGIRKTAGSDAGALVGSGFDAGDSPQSLGICTITDSTPTTHTWQITGCSTQDSSFNLSRSECSVYPYFWGVETCGGRPGVDNVLVTGGSKVVSSVGSSVSVTFNSSSQWTWIAIPSSAASRTKWFQGAAPNCGDINVIPTDKYPDECVLDISDGGGCWSTVSYKVYMSGSAATDGSTPIQFRTY